MAKPEHPPSREQLSPETTLMQLINGHRITQLIRVAAKLGLADLLTDGPKRSDELDRAVGAHPRTLYRVLRALASLEIFAADDAGRFHLTPLAELLRRGVPGSLADYAIMEGEPWYCHSDSELLYSIRTGKPAFDYVHGMGIFEYLHQHAEAAACFNAAQTSFSGHELAAIVAAYDFGEFTTIVDVGGGHGALLVEILKANPHPRGILFDLPTVVESAKGLLEVAGVMHRCDVAPGDFFQFVPGGGDAYMLKRVIHDWDDERAATILANCRQTMAATSRLLLMERVIPPGNAPSLGKLADINMLVHAGGLERTEAEFRMLLERTGFRLVKIVPTQSPICIIEASPE